MYLNYVGTKSIVDTFQDKQAVCLKNMRFVYVTETGDISYERHFAYLPKRESGFRAASIVLVGCGPGKESKTALVSETSLFSWEEEYILPEMEEEVEKVMERLGCNVVYQQIPSDAQEAEVLDYLKRRGG